MRCVKSDRDSGFTLLEVIIALAILSIALGLFYRVSADALAHREETRRESEAVILATSRLAEFGATLSTGDQYASGEAGEFRWAIDTSKLPDDSTTRNPLLAAFDVRIVVTWRDTLAERRLTLRTVRLVANASS